MFECFHNPPNSDMDYGIFNVHTDINACDCTRGCTDTVRESALKVDCRRKIPCRTGDSNLCRRRDGPMLYQLSYIPPSPAPHLQRRGLKNRSVISDLRQVWDTTRLSRQGHGVVRPVCVCTVTACQWSLRSLGRGYLSAEPVPGLLLSAEPSAQPGKRLPVSGACT